LGCKNISVIDRTIFKINWSTNPLKALPKIKIRDPNKNFRTKKKESELPRDITDNTFQITTYFARTPSIKKAH
jgi:hypothetical protein